MQLAAKHSAAFPTTATHHHPRSSAPCRTDATTTASPRTHQGPASLPRPSARSSTRAQAAMTTAPREVGVAIVGGGLGGLALALGLQRRGVDAHVFEGAPELRTATGTVVSLGANAYAALEGIHPGASKAVRSCGTGIELLERRLLPHGTATRMTPPPGFTMTRWADIQSSLAGLLDAQFVHCSHKATGYQEVADDPVGAGGGSGASAVVVRFQDRPDVRARLVVGADGVRSAIRRCMHPSDPGPRYLGHMHWNALLPRPGGGAALNTLGPRTLQAAMDCDPEKAVLRDFDHHSLVLDPGSDFLFWNVTARSEAPTFTAQQHQQNQQPSEPSRADAAPPPGCAGPTGGGPGVPGSKARVLAMVRRLGWDHIEPLVQATPEQHIFERALCDSLPLSSWVSPGGRAVLVGDAAHAMHPSPGQGTGLAFEDAHVLCEALAAQCRPDLADGAQLAHALAHFQALRLPRAMAVQAYAAEMAGLPLLVERMRPRGMSLERWAARFQGVATWVAQYPLNVLGDPSSEHWSPQAVAAMAEHGLRVAAGEERTANAAMVATALE